MATLREIRRRIAGVKRTQQITQAMKMVATAKLRRAQNNIIATRPYARHLRELMSHLVTKVDPSLHPLLVQRDLHNAVIIVITSDRGFCGAFNTNIIRFTEAYLKEHYDIQLKGNGTVYLYPVGRRGNGYFSKRWQDILGRQTGIFNTLEFSNAREIAEGVEQRYLGGKVDRVEVIYNEFKSVVQQRIVVEQLLPIPPRVLKVPPPAGRGAFASVDYIYEPSAPELVSALLPKHLNMQMWRILLESNAAEQAARRMAMDNATRNANDLIASLQLTYNKARQASITKELLEIVSGAEALSKSSA